jgi:hypothetical protein
MTHGKRMHIRAAVPTGGHGIVVSSSMGEGLCAAPDLGVITMFTVLSRQPDRRSAVAGAAGQLRWPGVTGRFGRRGRTAVDGWPLANEGDNYA